MPTRRIAADASIAAVREHRPAFARRRGRVIGPGCVIGEDCVIGAGSELMARVTLVTRVRLGRTRAASIPARCSARTASAWRWMHGRWIKVPQLGGVVVGDDCEIGANTTIDRGALDDTVLEEDVRLDNQIQIGHNVHIGAHTAMAGCAAVAGSAKIGRYCLIGGGAGILGHLEICDRVMITAMSLVTQLDTRARRIFVRHAADGQPHWRKNAARFKQLDALARRRCGATRNRDESIEPAKPISARTATSTRATSRSCCRTAIRSCWWIAWSTFERNKRSWSP